MSGYGGAPPSGWEDPYGGGSQGWDPGGAYGGGAYGGGAYGGGAYGGGAYGGGAYGGGWNPHGYGPPGVPQGSASNGSAIAALVCNAIALSMCCNIFAIPGIVTAGMALGRIHTDPRSARNLTFWSWAIFAASIVIAITVIVIFAILDTAEPDYGSSGGV
ncbi:hypothetical protein BZB76_5133 [Actinomadura pelletieri DSM 43383]|uniref:DUF4190 domain-containing protein n=1 Tax=Actinomadura pelletieri DSM 43383 TaxID=1120940 RepID=A0A495QJH5_9ACTN|nr:hypothetical protein [Actinomadura pelletieri]RKS72312.1 hypothetical protein BZB76_5133 [Actinomadura pelletieri DSM 43383]